MYDREVKIKNSEGLHGRPVTYLIQEANKYKSSIWIEVEERRVSAKSLLGVLTLGIERGFIIKIIANGDDEEQAVNALAKLIEEDFMACGDSSFGGSFSSGNNQASFRQF